MLFIVESYPHCLNQVRIVASTANKQNPLEPINQCPNAENDTPLPAAVDRFAAHGVSPQNPFEPQQQLAWAWLPCQIVS